MLIVLSLGYITDPITNKPHQLWMAKRSAQKYAYPSMWDFVVSGGVTGHDTPLSTILKEAEEEASLRPEFVLAYTKAESTVAYVGLDLEGYL